MTRITSDNNASHKKLTSFKLAEDVREYLATRPSRKRTLTIEEAVRRTKEFREWLKSRTTEAP